VIQIAYHVSTGIPLWGYPVHKGTVLYLALEDTLQRLQSRSYRMFDADGNDNLHFAISAGQIGSGLDTQLKNFIREHPDTSLIIIDTFQKVQDGENDNYSYANDYKVIGALKEIADSYGVGMLIVHHTRKQKAEDILDMVSGTNGLAGAADGAFVLLKKKRTDRTATLETIGRDQAEQIFNLVRNEETLVWELESVEKELWKEPPEPILDEVAKHITEGSPDWQGTATELVTLLGVDMKPNALSQKLNVNASRLLNEYNIRYNSSRSHDGRRITFHLEMPPA
jgi:RecA-family ATPase